VGAVFGTQIGLTATFFEVIDEQHRDERRDLQSA
jgi:hypothetical protein